MSQAQTLLPTVGTISGVAEQGLINGLAAALRSKFSGGSVPSAAGSPDGFQDWMDTSVSGQATWKLYLAATTSWLALMTIDTATGAISLNAASTQNWAAASGTHDAITAAYDPPVTLLIDGMVLFFRATAANLTQAPTFAPNGLTAHAITKNGGQQLWIGDIPGGNAEIALRYNAANTRWELLNPPDVPIGGIVPYFGASIPPGFALPQGQNLSSTTYPAASTVLGVTYGNPGGGNFTMPDMRGRLPAMLDAGGSGRITVAGGNWDGTVLGNTGGAQNRTIAQNQLPNVAPTFAGTSQTWNSNQGSIIQHTGSGGGLQSGAGITTSDITPTVTVTPAGTVSSINGGVSQQSMATLPPMMMINYMMRIA